MQTFTFTHVMHKWTYDAMCHDLLDMDGNKHVIEVTLYSLHSAFDDMDAK